MSRRRDSHRAHGVRRGPGFLGDELECIPGGGGGARALVHEERARESAPPRDSQRRR